MYNIFKDFYTYKEILYNWYLIKIINNKDYQIFKQIIIMNKQENIIL